MIDTEDDDSSEDDQNTLLTSNNCFKCHQLHANFILFSLLFSITHAPVDVILSFASSELSPSLASYSGFTLYMTYTLSALTIAKPFLTIYTKKFGVFVGLLCLLIYATSFFISIMNSSIANVLFIIGAFIGGSGAGILWTSQGSYFSVNAVEYARVSQQDETKIKSYFSSIFAATYLLSEATLTAFATLVYKLSKNNNFDWRFIVFPLYAALSFVSVVIFNFGIKNVDFFESRLTQQSTRVELATTEIHHGDYVSSSARPTSLSQNRHLQPSNLLQNAVGEIPNWSVEEIFREVTSVLTMIYSERKLQLIMPFQACFGLSAGMVNYYVNRYVTSAYLADGYIGVLTALGVVTAAALTGPFALISSQGSPLGLWSVMIFGGLCFFYGSLTLLVLTPNSMGNWPFLFVYYVVHGAARGVWESTNKAVIAEYFPSGQRRDAAFASVYFTSGLAGAFGLLFYQFMTQTIIASINVIASVLAIVCYHYSATLCQHELQCNSIPPIYEVLESNGNHINPKSSDSRFNYLPDTDSSNGRYTLSFTYSGPT